MDMGFRPSRRRRRGVADWERPPVEPPDDMPKDDLEDWEDRFGLPPPEIELEAGRGPAEMAFPPAGRKPVGREAREAFARKGAEFEAVQRRGPQFPTYEPGEAGPKGYVVGPYARAHEQALDSRGRALMAFERAAAGEEQAERRQGAEAEQRTEREEREQRREAGIEKRAVWGAETRALERAGERAYAGEEQERERRKKDEAKVKRQKQAVSDVLGLPEREQPEAFRRLIYKNIGIEAPPATDKGAQADTNWLHKRALEIQDSLAGFRMSYEDALKQARKDFVSLHGEGEAFPPKR